MAVQKVLKRAAEGGSLLAQITPVHTRACPFWHLGAKHGPCNCGAEALLEQYRIVQGAADPFASIKPF